MKNYIFALLFLSSLSPSSVRADDFDLGNYITIRKSFTTKSETTKPAEVAVSKHSNSDAVVEANAAVVFKGAWLSGKNYVISPAVQFNYSSETNKPREEVTGYLGLSYYVVPSTPGKTWTVVVEPSASITKDFKSKLEKISASLVLKPEFPEFIIPIQDATTIKYEEDGSDRSTLIWGLCPIIGFGHEEEISNKGIVNPDVKAFHALTKLELTFRKYYFQLNLGGTYAKELIDQDRTFLDVGASINYFLDKKERASINLGVDRTLKPTTDTFIKFSFGLKI